MTTSHTKETLVLQERIAALIGEGDVPALEAMLEELHPSDIADVVESLGEELRLALLRALPTELASEALAEMEEGEIRACWVSSRPRRRIGFSRNCLRRRRATSAAFSNTTKIPPGGS